MLAADPQGILQRAPELAELTHLPSVRRAIERGNMHGLYRALFFARLTGKARDKRDLLAMLLAHRRLFLTPMRGAPVLRTINGVGATVYGKSDFDLNDQTYIKTLFLVLVFVPVFPLGQYLVRDAGERGWTFIGKVPLGVLVWLWRTALSLALVGGILVALTSAFHSSRYNDVYVLNGLPIPVQVELDGKHGEIAAAGYLKLDTRAGDHPIAIKGKDGHAIENGTIHVEPGIDIQGWNVLGAAPLMREEVIYSANESARTEGPEATLACGTRTFGYDSIDFAFKEPPKSVSMSKGQNRASRSHVALIDGGADLCLRWLEHKNQDARAAELARDLAVLSDYDADKTRSAAYMTLATTGAPAAIEFARGALVKHEDAIGLHRIYQELRVRSGERDQAIAEYRARLAQRPDDVHAAYLVARLERGAPGRATLDALLPRAPRDAHVLRAHAYAHMLDADYAGALPSWQALEAADAAMYAESLPMVAETLVALGRNDDALHALERKVPDEDPGAAFERALAYAQVARMSGGDPDKLAHDLPQLAAEPPVQAWFHVRSGQVPAQAELAALEPDQRVAAALILSSRSAPGEAISRVPTMSAQVLHLLPAESWVLLYAEAVRLGENGGDAAARALGETSPGGSVLPIAIADFMHTGNEGADIEELPSSLRAALHFVRSRDSSLPSAERARLAQAARDGDVLHGLVTQALAAWPG